MTIYSVSCKYIDIILDHNECLLNSLSGPLNSDIPPLLMSTCSGRFLSLNATVKSFVERNDPRSNIIYSIVTDLSGNCFSISSFILATAYTKFVLFLRINFAELS